MKEHTQAQSAKTAGLRICFLPSCVSQADCSCQHTERRLPSRCASKTCENNLGMAQVRIYALLPSATMVAIFEVYVI